MPDRKTISFFVDGVPRTVGGNNATAWRRSVKAITRSRYTGKLLVGPVELHVIFWMPRPQTHFGPNGRLRPGAPRYHTVNPNTAKMFRSLEDSLTGILWKNDSQVVSARADKRYATKGTGAGASISVREIEGD